MSDVTSDARNKSASDNQTINRLYIHDKRNNLSFLIDTGADVSVIPKTFVFNYQNLKPTNFTLYTATGTPIHTYGKKPLFLNLGLRREFKWDFYICDVTKPLLGADFLRHYQLLVDVANNELIDNTTHIRSRINQITINKDDHSISLSCFVTSQVSTTWQAILQRYQEKTNTPEANMPTVTAEHLIETFPAIVPITSRPRRLPPEKYLSAKKEFEQMVAEGICQPSKSPWASPLHLAPKKNGQWRPCGDYRKLNAVTVPDRYPVPNMLDCVYILNKANFFTTLDIVRAYNQIPVASESIPKTAVTTPFGLYEFLKMPFGLRNAGQTFQRFIDQVLRGLDFIFVYIDDILIASETFEQHQEHVSLVLDKLAVHHININIQKCHFGKKEVDFLGFRITNTGISPLPEKTIALREYKKPTNIQELRRFLGLINFYRRHIPNAAELQAPLHDVLHNKTKKNDKTPIDWTNSMENAFQSCKESLTSTASLAYPDNSELALICDASETSIGAVLQQSDKRPLGFFSKKLSVSEVKYSTYDRELLAIYAAVIHFRIYLEGREVTIYTDHKPLIYAFQTKHSSNSRETTRRARQLEFISQFTTTIKYLKGEENEAADALSRVQEISYTASLNYEEIAKAQLDDVELKQYQQQLDMKFENLKFPALKLSLTCETSTGKFRPYVPKGFRKQVFDSIHGLAHAGIRETRRLVTEKFFWPSMNKDVHLWAKTCISCQRSKVHKHTKTELLTIPTPKARFSCVHLDIVGPLPVCESFRYCITLIDRYSHWPEVIPVADIRTETVVRSIFMHWISRFGSPEIIITDRGTQFESALFTSFYTLLGIRRVRTTAYHPQSNGKIERFHRTLKTAITAHNKPDWLSALPAVLLGLRTALRDDAKYSSAEILYGEGLRLPSEMFSPNQNSPPLSLFMQNLKENLSFMQPAPTKWNSKQKPFVSPDLKTATHIFLREDMVRRPLSAPYTGPHEVIARNDKTIDIRVNGHVTKVSLDRVKPAYILQEDQAAAVRHDHDYTFHNQNILSSKKTVRFQDNSDDVTGGGVYGVSSHDDRKHTDGEVCDFWQLADSNTFFNDEQL